MAAYRLSPARRMAWATRTAWTVSATSWARITWAPPSTAAAVAASEPGRRSRGIGDAGDRPDEGLAGDADVERAAERAQRGQAGQHAAIPLVPGHAVAAEEADARVHHDALVGDPGGAREGQAPLERRAHGGHGLAGGRRRGRARP